MQNTLFDRFAPVIRNLRADELADSAALAHKLEFAREGQLSVSYIPFEYINPRARVVIVGITPGQTQLVIAVAELRRQLDRGADATSAQIAAKRTGAFSGTMRPNLIHLLDRVGIHTWLRIPSCAELFASAADLVQTTSVLRHPVFVGGQNYNGQPNMVRTPFLRDQLVTHFGAEARQHRDAVFIPLGDKVAEALLHLAENGVIPRARILTGLPHPSGANAERIAYFLGQKARSALSSKTDPDKLDGARVSLTRQVAALA